MIVALYARVSTAKQAERDLSIPDQLRHMREWARQQGYTIAAEYEEPGASATDDRRPVFQKMIEAARATPSPFNAILVHSFSRFFRDLPEFCFYERMLEKHGVRVFSITQPTSDDPSGEMVRRIFSMFDEYQSKENAKHTLRAMNENARQGFYNGSKPPFGLKAVAMDVQGRHGPKKKLNIDQDEALVVKQVFDLYIHGHRGKVYGVAQIAAFLNDQGTLRRGKRWSKATIGFMLANPVYIGEHYFNRIKAKAQSEKPQEEWIRVPVDPILDPETFARAQELRESRSPDNTPPRIVNSPTLLTGLVKCVCGASMTIATGKGGRYRYYKCTSRINHGKNSCSASNVSMEKLDELVLDAVVSKIFTPERVEIMLKEYSDRLNRNSSRHDDELKRLSKEHSEVQKAVNSLYAAIEQGNLPVDTSLKERIQNHHARREEILSRMAVLRHEKEMVASQFDRRHVDKFCQLLEKKFRDRSSDFGKEYLRLLISKIIVDGNKVTIYGSHAALAGLLKKTKVGELERVPTFGDSWLRLLGSNQRHVD